MIICPRCSKENADHYKFCLGCGSELKPKSEAMASTVMADSSARTAVPSPTPPGGTAKASGPVACPSCGADVPEGFLFCGKCGTKIEPDAGGPAAPVTAPASPAATRRKVELTLIRPDGTEGGTMLLEQGENRLGRGHGELFASDGYLSPDHALLIVEGDSARLSDLDSLNGVFRRIEEEVELPSGTIFRVGQELIRFDTITSPSPLEDGTEVMGSPNPGYWGRLSVIIGRDVDGAAFPLLEDTVSLGRERGDINFPDDGYVSGLHARVTRRDKKALLSDAGSSNGTFIRVYDEVTLGDQSFILLGQQLFRINL